MGGVSSVTQSTTSAAQRQRNVYKIEIEMGTEEATVNKEVKFILSIMKVETSSKDSTIGEGSEPEVKVKFEALADNTQEEAAITCTCRAEPYKYTVLYIPHIRGRYIVTVNVDRTQTVTQEVFVQCPPEIMATVKPEKLSITVNSPSKIIVDERGSAYVLHISNSTKSPEIARYNRHRRNEKPITSKYKSGQASMFEFSNWNPKAIATDSDKNIYIAHLHSLDKLSPKGELLKSINFENTKTISTEVVHCIPEGMCFHKDRLYLCNGYSNTVLVFDTSLDLQQSLKIGRDCKYLQEPHDIDLDDEGNIYITDLCAHKVFVYTSNGHFMHTIGSHGKKDGQLEKPVSLVVVYRYVYIAEEMNHRISVFKTSGEYVCSFRGDEESSQLHYPTHIAIDHDGYLYLCDHRDRILRF